MLFFLNFLFYQVNRTAFYFHVCLCQILPQNTRAEKLYAAGHQDDAHQRRPAGHRISEDQLPHDDKYDHQKGNDAEQHAHKGSDQKRCRGKCGDTVKEYTRSFQKFHLVSPLARSTFSYSSHLVLKPTQPKIPLVKRLYSRMDRMASTICLVIRR